MSHKDEPEWSCPSLDSAIDSINDARKIHQQLRDWGHYWKDAFDELEKESSEEIESLKEEISSLKSEIDDLKNELKEATA